MGVEDKVGPMMKGTSVFTYIVLLIFCLGIGVAPTTIVVMLPQEELGAGVKMGIYNLCINPAKSAADTNSMAGLIGALIGGLSTLDPNVQQGDEWTCGAPDGSNATMRMIMCIIAVCVAGAFMHVAFKGAKRGAQIGIMIVELTCMSYLYFVPLFDTGGIATPGMGEYLLMACAGLTTICLIMRLMVNDAGAAMMATEVQSEARVQSESSEGSESVGKEESSEA